MAKYSRTNLIINYLPQDFSDEEFRSLFSSVAPVKRAKVCRDKRTGYSFGFGFCEFYSAEDASRAINALNGLQLQRKTIKVAYARLQSAESKNCNLHLTNLPAGVTAGDIHALLSPHGGIINCKILCDSSGASRGIGFCLFETRSAASDALEALHGKAWPGGISGGGGGGGSSDAEEQQLQQPLPPVQVRFADENEKKVRPPSLATAAVAAVCCHQPQQQQQQLQAPPLPPPPMQLPPPPSMQPPPPPPPPYEFYANAAPYMGGPYGYHPAMPYQFYPPPPPLPLQPPPPPQPQQQQQQQQPPPAAQLESSSSSSSSSVVVCVSNLPPGTDECQLCAMFAPFGGLADVLLEPSAGYQPAPAEGDLQTPGPTAMVAFASYQSAASAAAHWHGQSLCGRVLQAWLRGRGGLGRC